LATDYIDKGGNPIRFGEWNQQYHPRTESVNTTQAPDSAIQHLKAHPELKDAFKAKYGYLP
jgi:cytochrome c peroxidase